MSYAIRKDGKGWRAVGSAADINADENYSEAQPDLITPDPKDLIRAQIKSMEQAQLMPRATREFMLLFLESQFTPTQLAQNIGYTNLKAFDSQITALRNQL